MTSGPQVEYHIANFSNQTIFAIAKKKPGDAINLYECRCLLDEATDPGDVLVHYYLTGADIESAKGILRDAGLGS